MKTFFNVEDLGDLKAALAEAQEVKANRFGYQELGKNKTLLMIFPRDDKLCNHSERSFSELGKRYPK